MIDSHLNIQQLSPASVLDAIALEDYYEWIDRVWSEILRLNSSLFVLRKLLDFKSDSGDLFLNPNKDVFLSLVTISLTHDSLLIITKLLSHQKHDLFSLHKLKHWIRNHISDSDYLKSFDNACKSTFKGISRDKREKMDELRHNIIAHWTIDEKMKTKINTNTARISYEELQSMCDRLNDIFDVFCFDVVHAKMMPSYIGNNSATNTSTKSDIEQYLDFVVQDSYVFNEPERPYWDKSHYSPDQIVVLNKWRKKLGKPEV